MAKSALAQQLVTNVKTLLVEDSASDAYLVEAMLTDSKTIQYETRCVASQAAALEALAEESFDVCLMDLTLPDADGFSAMLHMQEKAPDLPILVLTGMNDMRLAKGAVGRGAQDYLLKDEMEAEGLNRAINYAIERKRLEKELFQRANFDTLTRLSNRNAYISRLHMALARHARSHMGIAILFIDLDHFKPINDQYGHEIGDKALMQIAERIRSVLRPYDLPARFGGDEFVVLLEDIYSARDAANIAEKIIHEISKPMQCSTCKFTLGASIGIAVADTQVSAETLLHHADLAMYHAKKRGNCYQFYVEDMQHETRQRMTLETELKQAVEQQQLRLYYQPYINPDGEALIGVEALIRFAHPTRGMLHPYEFLPTAQAAHLMPALAKWQCEQLMRDIGAWKMQDVPPLEIAVNFSGAQLDAPDILDWLAPIAYKKFIAPHRLAVEIPEDAISNCSEARFKTIGKMAAMGMKLHLDHFGVGSTSLSALHALPFSLLKLDMSLIKKMSGEVSGDTLIRAAIMLAHQLGMKAGAVGVENAWQAEHLRAHTCDRMQGFLTASPMSSEQFMQWLKHPSNM